MTEAEYGIAMLALAKKEGKTGIRPRQSTSGHGISPRQRENLEFAAKHNGRVALSEFSRHLKMRSSDSGSCVAALVTRGLLVRTNVRRKAYVEITPLGRSYLKGSFLRGSK